MKPETQLSKRVSHLFFGHLSAPCICGQNGQALKVPHECPNMQTAMLKACESGDKNSDFVANGQYVILMSLFRYGEMGL